MQQFNSNLEMLDTRGNIELSKNNEGISITCPGDNGSVIAPGKYTIPLKIDLLAKTDSTNIRLSFGKGAAIFNLERNEHELRVKDPVNKDFRFGVEGKGNIPINEFVNISWILDYDYMILSVNGEIRVFRQNLPYMKLKNEGIPFPELEVGVASAMGSVVTIKELTISEWNHADHNSEPLVLLFPNQAYVKEGESNTLESRIFPDTAKNKNIKWVSDNKHLAVTDLGDGKIEITGIEQGIVELRGMAEAGGVSKVCKVEILDPSLVCVIGKREPKQKIMVKNSNISGSEFTECTASDLEFKNVSIPNLKIDCADVTKCFFNNLNMSKGKITDADLSELVIDGAQWGGAHFQYIGYGNQSRPDLEHNKLGVLFSNCSFQNGTLSDCNFSNTRLENCKIEGLTINGVPVEQLMELYRSLNNN
jgi:hypothetical protein